MGTNLSYPLVVNATIKLKGSLPEPKEFKTIATDSEIAKSNVLSEIKRFWGDKVEIYHVHEVRHDTNS
jgi:hypothetical protein